MTSERSYIIPEEVVQGMKDSVARLFDLIRDLLAEAHRRPDYEPSPKYLLSIVKASDGSKIPEDEPLFVVRGQDLLAPQVLLDYADRFEVESSLDEDERRAIAATIREHAATMRDWRVQKWPD